MTSHTQKSKFPFSYGFAFSLWKTENKEVIKQAFRRAPKSTKEKKIEGNGAEVCSFRLSGKGGVFTEEVRFELRLSNEE